MSLVTMMTGTSFRETRKTAGLSLTALAKRASVSRWRLIEFELGNLEITSDELSRLQEAIRRGTTCKIAELGDLCNSLEGSKQLTKLTR